MVLMTTFASAMDSDDPSERNSNLLPVKANGEVRLRSVLSLGNFGSTLTPISRSCFSLAQYSFSSSKALTIADSSSPRNMEIIAGGASFAPRRWSLPADATEMRSKSAYSSTALITAVRISINCAEVAGSSPGSS